jgi:iron complex transport system ATP-binding protein
MTRVRHDHDGLVAELREVGVRRSGTTILADVSLTIGRRDHLAVLGPNGAGKTTLLRVLSTYLYPTHGEAMVLGTTFGRGDLRELRHRIGFVSVGLDPLVHERAAALPLVAVACRGGLWPPPGILDDPDLRVAAERALQRVGASHLADRRVDTLSQGERQRVRIARALATDPDLLLLDEPFAGLDLGGREALLADVSRLLADPDGPTAVIVTHHLEELPPAIGSALLLREGRQVAAGPVSEVLADEPVSEAFGLDVEVRRHAGRWTATASTLPARP